MIERLSALPGVRSVALSATPPISPGNWASSLSIPGYTPAPKEDMTSILNRVSGQYFETAGISIVAGRPITPADTLNSLKVAVVSQSIAKRYFPNGDAVGRTLKIDIDSVSGPWQIVGVARDTISGNPRAAEPMRMTYIALAQIAPFLTPAPASPSALSRGESSAPPAAPEENQDCFAYTILLRTSVDPTKSIADLRAAMAGIDPNLTLIHVSTIQDMVTSMMTHEELISTLTSLFSALALLLAAIGLYGVMSYSVVRRTNEIGIRLALGAQTTTVLWMVMREALVLLCIGVVLGLPLALLSTKVIKQQLFGLSALDPATFLLAISVVGGMTIFAAWLPANRAAKVDPMIALRCD